MLGIDSSAAQAILKLRDSLAKQFGIRLTIFVTGKEEGFPCEINLSKELKSRPLPRDNRLVSEHESLVSRLSGSDVCNDLDEALILAEVSNQRV